MNDPNKAISVNLSSLLSLKAELLRKQTEVSKAKATRITNEEYSAASKHPQSKTSKREKQSISTVVEKKDDGTTVYEHEDTELLEKSKRVLEAKSKFYERMSRSGGALNSDDNCLVRFNRKHQEERIIVSDDDEDENKNEANKNSDQSSSDSDNDDDPEDWVEYTDCLGRTRTCLAKDLASVKKRDEELAASMPERLDQSKANWMIDTKGARNAKDDDDADSDTLIGPPAPPDSIFSDGCSLMSKHDEQRSNWEKKEQENLEKAEVHYQDVFFDEARQHGVGYYAFSTDEAERKRQQEELENSRQQTLSEQQRRDALRAQREKIIAERVRAAKNRQRARLGLPPLEAEELKQEEASKSDIELNETKEERKARKRAEKLKKRQEAAEAEREKEREQHIRPWDEHKEGVNAKKPSSSEDGFVAGETEWTYKPERIPLSQEEWNERKRAERIPEFAPVPEKEVQPTKLKRTNFSSFDSTDQYNLMPPPPLPNSSNVLNTFANYQTTKREKVFQRRNYEEAQQFEPEKNDRTGAAIPPPANLDADYGLPSHAKRPKTNSELERSIEAGLRFLRDNCDKGTMSTKSTWTAKADY